MIKTETRDRRRALYEDARRVLQARMGQDVSVEQVAREVATSRRQLQRAFAQAGTTFQDELLKLRVERAQQLLARDERVSRVAHAVGYRQPSQFAKAFRRATGKSPAEYRAGRSAALLERAA